MSRRSRSSSSSTRTAAQGAPEAFGPGVWRASEGRRRDALGIAESLELGDLCFVVDEGMFYRCTGVSVGASIWEPCDGWLDDESARGLCA